MGAGKGSGHVSEQLGFDEIFRNGRTIDLEKGPCAPGAEPVDLAGEHVLAHAGLALQQHGGIRSGHAFHEMAQFHHLAAAGHNGVPLGRLLVDVLNVLAVFFDEMPLVGDLILELGHEGDVADKGDHQSHLTVVPHDGVPVENELVPVPVGLHHGRGLAGLDHLGVDHGVELAVLGQDRYMPADQVHPLQAGEFFVHGVDGQGAAFAIGDIDPIPQQIEDAADVPLDSQVLRLAAFAHGASAEPGPNGS